MSWFSIWRRSVSIVSRTFPRPAPHNPQTPFPLSRYRTPLSQKKFASQYPWPPRRQPRYSRFGQSGQNSPPVSRIGAIWQNYSRVIIGGGVGLGIFYVYNREPVPVSGRMRFNFLSPEMEASITAGQYQMVLQQFQGQLLPSNHPATRMAHRIVSRIVHANDLEAQQWVVHVVHEDKEANAFCMPGGQIFVFTGILPYTKDENGLATVLGHEMAHKVARHHAEQISGRFWAFIFVAAAALIGDVSSGLSRQIYDLVFDLRNSRTQENEADQLGLLMMAKACYDPHAAIPYWQRMVDMEKTHGHAPPQFLSTHPASQNRVKSIEHLIPAAMQEAEQSECGFTKGAFDQFQNIFGDTEGSSTVRLGVRKSSGEDERWF